MIKTATADAPALGHPGVLERIQEILGVQRLRTDQDLVQLVEHRLSARSIDALREVG